LRSSRKDRRAGKIDMLIGRVADAFGKLTGDRKTRAKGKAARARGRGRSAKGRAKRGAR
jgi:uncharacterized protein YjbJ (UPF0337 family)